MFRLDAVHFGEVKVISPTRTFSDSRGEFAVEFRKDDFKELGLPTEFVQDNSSRSVKNVIRGLHFQMNPPMGKLMRVTSGRALLVAVDFRPESPTFLQWTGVEASAENRIQVWAPATFARGFCSLTDDVVVRYKCTGYFDAKGDDAVRWDDPDISVKWPITDPLLSERDRTAKFWRSHDISRTSGDQRAG
jgi:dTDP-4-dehydrorhamnose 3,5-epimerase